MKIYHFNLTRIAKQPNLYCLTIENYVNTGISLTLTLDEIKSLKDELNFKLKQPQEEL